MPAGKSCRDLLDRQFSSRNGHDQLVGRVVRRVEVNVVEAVEDNDGKPPDALVTVDQRMVADERVEQRRCFAVQVGVRLVSIQNGARAMSRRLKQSEVANRSYPEVLHPR